MTRLIERSGDIFTTDAPAIGHGVNTHGVMGAGIAAQFRDRYPDMFESYRGVCLREELSPGGCMVWLTAPRVILNIASQDAPGANARLEWLISGVCAAVGHVERYGLDRLAVPQIGCGIGGLSWSDVLPALRDIAESGPVDIEAWTFAAPRTFAAVTS